MFKWRRRNEGFEWREYVRTTILVRRKERQQKVRDVRDAAVDQIKDAGRRSLNAGVVGASSAGKNVGAAAVGFSSWVRRSTRETIAAARPRVRSAAEFLGSLAGSAGASVASKLDPMLVFLREPHIRLPLSIISVMSALAALHRTWSFAFDQMAAVALTFAAIAAALLGLSRLSDTSDRNGSRSADKTLERWGYRLVLLPGLDRLTPTQAGAVVLGLCTVLVAGACMWLALGHPSQHATKTNVIAAATSTTDPSVLEGRATAEGGDRLRISGTRIKLAGVESPEPDQMCVRAGEKWRCGAAAKDALARALKGHRVSCDVSGASASGLREGRCSIDGADLASTLVQSGHVFAEPGLFSRYGGEENDARLAKAGLWSGEADRPADYRAKVWEEAKQRAPSGCPIKGRVASGARVYVLPGSASYESIRLSTTRGERWFCSEEEAQAAGWRPVSSSRGAS